MRDLGRLLNRAGAATRKLLPKVGKAGAQRSRYRAFTNRDWSGLEPLEERVLLAIGVEGVPDWVEQGPSTIINGNTVMPAQNNPQSGAVQAIAVHPDGDHIWLGTVSGGIWRTDDLDLGGATPNPIWTPQTDQYASLSISDIAISPKDVGGLTLTAGTPANQTVLWASTTSVSSSGRTAGGSQGLLLTRDGGEHWSMIGQDTFAGLQVTGVAPLGSDVLGMETVFVSALDRTDPRTNIATRSGGIFSRHGRGAK